ncbi:hypothetical protein H072_8227 [Dactylellina haptotyla CBS 200.50]|uniref:AAA+ ATPase domain-containing protein n=1 Tax=Dactylellina haptotyla (strain CBS 200.50) TaxID=1284197 RepID=S8BFI2_DACHA|nr:hypothetical protein H072_8227 [Dactylellina haptotyla CBS 200.50]
MGGKKQDSISNFFVEIPAVNRDLPLVQDLHLESPHLTKSDNGLLPAAPAPAFLPTPGSEILPGIPDVLPHPVEAISEKVLHPFFNKEARIAIQLQKSKPSSKTDKLATILNEETSKVTKPKKRGRKRKDTSISNLAVLGAHGEIIEGILEELGNSDGDFPTPSSTHSSDYEDSGNEGPLTAKPVKKRRKHASNQASLPSPPRSSENEPVGAPNSNYVALPLRETPPPIPSGHSIVQVDFGEGIMPGAGDKVLTSVGLAEQSKLEATASVSATARSAFDLMKKSATMTKTRSRSMSPPPLGTDGPPTKKARTRGRPRKSAPDGMDFAFGDLEALPSIILPAPKPSLIVKLNIGREAAERLANPPKKESLIAVLKLRREHLEKFVPKQHPFFMKTSEKRKQAVLEDVEKVTINSKALLHRPATNFLSSFQPKPKFKPEYLPAWPSKENIHVRNIEDDTIPTPPCHNLRSISYRKGKAKGSDITPAESALEILQNHYTKLHKKHAYQDDLIGPPAPRPTVRLPEKKLHGAKEILHFLREQITYRLRSEETHPAIRELLDKVGNGELLLTAFDQGDCESQPWAASFAPTNSSCVLQTGQEAKELSKWLKCMQITSIDTGLNQKPKTLQAKKKKKPKNELDDFIVSEEEDHDSMDELTDPEDVNVLFPGMHSSNSLRKSEIRRKSRSAVLSVALKKPRTSSPPPKLPNAILLSGPSGVGKTAAVYAAAKEHGFVVFEINAGTKRGGKEIQEMVGDMSRNHLVHQVRNLEQSATSEPELVSKPVNSFFAKKGPAPAKEGTGLPEQAKEKEKVQQQQSLILIEEADILFEEDNGFWRSIMTLMEKSRRPVVITCNDESLLPLEDLDLYAKLRFKPASLDLAADYLLVMAAAQGHFLDRSVIRKLYDEYNYDLRRTITQLNFWCQMAVGDHTWCGRWFYTRDDPEKGKDRTPAGEVKRSISDGTYLLEIDSFGRELLMGENGSRLTSNEYDEVAVWKDVRDSSCVDLGDRFYHGGLEAWMHTSENSKAFLFAYSDYIDSLSALDMCGGFSTSTNELIQHIDPCRSSLKDKRSPDNLVDIKILDAEQKPDPLSTGSLLSATGHILARNVLRDTNKVESTQNLFAPFTETDIVSMISTKRAFNETRRRKQQGEMRYPFEKIMHGHTQLIRPLSVLVETIPYIREIARFDQQNEEFARETSNLVSQRPGGSNGKKRTTRASAFASEGRHRGGVRPRSEQYFRGSLGAMIGTGGKDWADAVDLYTYRPEPEPEIFSIVQVTFDEVHVAQERMLETLPIPSPPPQEDEGRQSRRKVIHDDIEEWPSEV